MYTNLTIRYHRGVTENNKRKCDYFIILDTYIGIHNMIFKLYYEK